MALSITCAYNTPECFPLYFFSPGTLSIPLFTPFPISSRKPPFIFFFPATTPCHPTGAQRLFGTPSGLHLTLPPLNEKSSLLVPPRIVCSLFYPQPFPPHCFTFLTFFAVLSIPTTRAPFSRSFFPPLAKNFFDRPTFFLLRLSPLWLFFH